MVSDPAFAEGLIDALVKLVKEDGVLATFAGLQAMLAKQVPYTMTKQVSFDFITSAMYKAAAAMRAAAGQADAEVCDARTALAITFAAAVLTSMSVCCSRSIQRWLM